MKNILLLSLLTSAAYAGTTAPTSTEECTDHSHHHVQPDAPISIMGDHLHHQGGWMLSYRYMFMDMDGMYQGSDAVSPGQVYNSGYLVSPTRMTMEMHMLGAMYAPTDNITLMAMMPYTSMDMDHRIDPTAGMLIMANGGSQTFTTKSSGIGDLKLGALFRIKDSGPHHFHGGLTFSLPTGSIGEKDNVPGPGGRLQRQLPAAMQLGSGSFDVIPSLTYVHSADSWSAGAQATAVWRTATNYHDYRLGNRFGLNTWFSYKATSWMSVSAGLSYLWEDELSGRQSDVATNPPMPPNRLTVPTAFGFNYGGQRIEVIGGVSFRPFESHRLAFDVRVPLWQDRNGTGLGTDYTATGGYTVSF